jgi:arginine:ornithine antiporter/lysine permease
VYLLVTLLSLGVVPRSELAEMRNPSMAGLMVKLMGSWGEIVIAAGLIVSVCGAYLSWTIMAAEVPSSPPRIKPSRACSPVRTATTPLRLAVADQYQRSGVAGADLADRFGLRHPADHRLRDDPRALSAGRRFLLKIATRPLHQAVGIGACIYGLWLLYASGPVHLLLSVVLYAPGLLVFLYARRTHQHDRSLKRRELALIGLLLVAAVPATWMLVG